MNYVFFLHYSVCFQTHTSHSKEITYRNYLVFTSFNYTTYIQNDGGRLKSSWTGSIAPCYVQPRTVFSPRTFQTALVVVLPP
jgi:hypothetical protein